MKVSKAEVQKKIQTQTIQDETIYYSYAQKCQATLSMLKNERLLLFNANTGMLYYINEPKQLPFKTSIPKPKNDCANMNVSIAKNPPGTNEFKVQFVMKNQKNQQVNVEWQFVLQNNTLAQDWVRVIQNYKNKKIQQMMENEEKKKNAIKNQNQKVNNAWIHDTLGFGLMQVSKKSQPKIEPKVQPEIKSPQKRLQEMRKSQINNINESNTKKSQFQTSPLKKVQDSTSKPQVINQGSILKMTESKFSKQPQKSALRQSVISIRQSNTSNIRESKIITQGNQINNQSKPQSESNIRGSNVSPTINQSKINPSPNQLSPQLRKSIKKEQADPRMSKITLRDELQSILQRSHLKQSQFQNNYISQQQSRMSEKQNYSPLTDWNLKFLRKRNEQVLLDFQQYALKAFQSILKEDQSSNEQIRVYFKSESMICVANARTIEAKKLKTEFRNYHFIMESCKDNFIVGVPLSCLIQFQGVVCLVQSLIPQSAPQLQLTQQVLNQLKDLQRYTRIKNNILKKATLYDLTQFYQSKDKTLIYINQLIQYLPIHLQESYQSSCLRPQHILDNVNQFMQGGMPHDANRQGMKTLHDTLSLIEQNVKILAKQLSTHDVVFAHGHELKNIMHQRGINLKYLPLLYSQVTHKSVKRYIHTFMVAKIAKDDLLQNLSEPRFGSSPLSPKQTVQSFFKLLIQGSSSTSNQLWKQIALKFRKQYNVSMSHHDIAGPFFLSCLIKIVPAVYDLSKLNDQKTFFKDDGIINKGFIVQLVPKVKSFYRYTTELTDKIIYTCKEQKLKENYTAIVQQLKLTSEQIPRSFELSKANEDLKQYLSYFTCPTQFQSKSYPHLKLFQSVGQEPPTSLSLSITRNYLQWCLDKQQLNLFKQTVQQTFRIIDFWFDPAHIYHCEFLELLSSYFEMSGAIDQSIRLVKQSLATCLKNGAAVSKKTGNKYFVLAQKQLRAGRKNDSMQNFIKAKNIMQSFKDDTAKYPITLMKLSSLYLNANDFQNCIIYSKLAVDKFQQLQNIKRAVPAEKGYYDRYCIKAIQIMTRAFQIENKKAQLYRVAQLTSAKYNRTSNPQVFEQLVKICLTAVIFKHNQQKCAVFQSLIQKLSVNNQSEQVPASRCLEELMHMAQSFNVMQKFMFKIESLQRILADINGRRALLNDTKEFISIVKNVIGLVGEDYVYGLIRQKEFQ